ncbi:MAG: hypothetical protein ABIP39_12850, partial [Polyangiaceae bacterium]
MLVTLALGPPTSDARADGKTDLEARAAYDGGAQAYDAHDFPHAALLFAHADELVPNPLVLKLALAAATQADDPVVGMTLALRAETRAVDGSLADLAKQARRRFEGQVGLVRVRCAARGKCRAQIGERSAGDGELIPVLPGEVEASFDEAHVVRLAVTARATIDLVEPAPFRAPPPPPAPTPPEKAAEPTSSGVSPFVFWSGLVVTGVLGGVTSIS